MRCSVRSLSATRGAISGLPRTLAHRRAASSMRGSMSGSEPDRLSVASGASLRRRTNRTVRPEPAARPAAATAMSIARVSTLSRSEAAADPPVVDVGQHLDLPRHELCLREAAVRSPQAVVKKVDLLIERSPQSVARGLAVDPVALSLDACGQAVAEYRQLSPMLGSQRLSKLPWRQ